MCWIAVLFHVNAHYPLIVAANREESFGQDPLGRHQWAEAQPYGRGRDELAGGTWLGVNATGLVAAVTNRPASAGMPPCALGVCSASTPCAVIHQARRARSLLTNSPAADSTPSIFSA